MSRVSPPKYPPLEVQTRKGRIVLPDWVHVRLDLWSEILDILSACEANLDKDPEHGWIATECAKVLAEIPGEP